MEWTAGAPAKNSIPSLTLRQAVFLRLFSPPKPANPAATS